MKPCIHMVTLGTRCLGEASDFYEHGLGWPKMDFDGDIRFFMLEGCWLSLYPWELLAQDAQVPVQGEGFRGVTMAHIVSEPERVLTTLDEAKRAGGCIVKPGQETDWGGFSGYFSDLDGHLWEVAYNPFFTPGPKGDGA